MPLGRTKILSLIRPFGHLLPEGEGSTNLLIDALELNRVRRRIGRCQLDMHVLTERE